MNILLLIFLNFLIQIKCFEEINLEVGFKEEQENGSLVIDLSESIDLLKQSKTNFEIKILNSCSNIYLNQFKVLSNKIDREEICSNNENCFLNCKILIQKGNEMKLIRLKINIEDINDHSPKFNKKNYFYLIENQHFQRIQLEQAQDKDLTFANSISNYFLNFSSQIEKETFPFELNFDENQHVLQLILIRPIQQQNFHFQLFAQDRQNRTDFCFIQIQIQTNLHLSSPPKFKSNLYQFFITNLDEKQQQFIGQVQLEHQNNSNEQFYFRLIPFQQFFQINQTNGQIYLTNSNQILQQNFYQFSVEVFYSNFISSLTTVQIFINNSNSNQNQNQQFIQILIPKRFQKSSNQISIQENSSVPLTILQIFLSSSSSSSSNLQLKSTISTDVFFQLKQFDEQSFELILQQPFDFEQIQEKNFFLNLTNDSIKKSIEIFIENINDNPPQFNQTYFHFEIKENNQFPLLLSTFDSFDRDLNLTSISYRIQIDDFDPHFFSIDSTNGQLFVQTSFDRESKQNYSFSVCVSDQLFESCSNVFVEILDENDNVCSFNSTIFRIEIDENLPSFTNLIQIKAQDPDSNENGRLQYSFTTQTEYLRMNSSNGLIQTTSLAFDYELFHSISIEISACDNFNSQPSFCCSTQLVILVQDLNDNLPFLSYPSDLDQIFLINLTNQSMPQLKAQDRDSFPQHRQIFFQILPHGSLSSHLSIDSHSGQLHLLSPSSTSLPLFGTLPISISSQVNLTLTILIFDHRTDPQPFLLTIQQQSSSSSFYSSFFFSLLLLLFFGFFIFISLIFIVYLYKCRSRVCHIEDPLMNTPSTTTLSTKSISNSNSTKYPNKLHQTYYSFGDNFLSPQPIYL